MTTIATGNRRLLLLATMLEAMADMEDSGAPMEADADESAAWYGVPVGFLVALGDFSERPRGAAIAIRKFIKTRGKP